MVLKGVQKGDWAGLHDQLTDSVDGEGGVNLDSADGGSIKDGGEMEWKTRGWREVDEFRQEQNAEFSALPVSPSRRLDDVSVILTTWLGSSCFDAWGHA